MSSARLYKSGYEKRKKKKEQQNTVKQCKGSMLKFVRPTATEPAAMLVTDTESATMSMNVDEIDATITTSRPISTFPTMPSIINEAASALIYSMDPAEWKVDVDLMQHFANNTPAQNCDGDLHQSARQFGKKCVMPGRNTLLET